MHQHRPTSTHRNANIYLFFLNAVYDNVKIQEITILYHSLENKPDVDFPSKVRSYL